MDDRFWTTTIRAAVAIVMAIAATQASLAARPGRADAPGATAGARGAAAPLVLAQYNGCPNGRCR